MSQLTAASFPYAPEIVALDGQDLPGFETPVTLIRDVPALEANADDMVNATHLYANRAETGEWALLRFTVDAVDYNASLVKINDAWFVQEANTRFNEGGVSSDITKALMQIATSLNG